MGRGTFALVAPRDSRALLPVPACQNGGGGRGCVPNLRPVLLIPATTFDLLNTPQNLLDPVPQYFRTRLDFKGV